MQVQKLNRASRLLLGALVEAYDVLQQLQAECGDGSGHVDPGVQVNLERVRLLVNRQSSSSSVISSQPSPVSPPPFERESLQQSEETINELTTNISDNQIIPKNNTEDKSNIELSDNLEMMIFAVAMTRTTCI